MQTDSQRRAKRLYKQRLRQQGRLKSATVEFTGDELELYDRAKAQGSVASYIKELIRQDMEAGNE